jgi:signal transduction histidine kinase
MTVTAAARGRLRALRAAVVRSLGLVDVAVAAALTAGGLVEVANLSYRAPVALGVASCVVSIAPVAVRRRAPFVVAVVATTAMTVYEIATHDPDGSFMVPAAVLVYYSAGRAAAERAAWTRLAALLGYALVASPLMGAAIGKSSVLSALSGWPLTVVPVAAGIVVARRASLVRRLAEATASLRDEQRVRAERLLGEERNRVARELHDVVAHHVSVMVIQAGGARLVAATDPVAAEEALQVVERSGRGALADLRRIMGVMRRTDAPDADTSIGLAHLDQLVERTRASGVPVEVDVCGPLDQVPSAVGLVAYRVVQEALTNVVKHARPATARVAISVGAHSIDDTGTTRIRARLDRYAGTGSALRWPPECAASRRWIRGSREHSATHRAARSPGGRRSGRSQRFRSFAMGRPSETVAGCGPTVVGRAAGRVLVGCARGGRAH